MPEFAREPEGVEGGRFILLALCFLFSYDRHKQNIRPSFSSLVNHNHVVFHGSTKTLSL